MLRIRLILVEDVCRVQMIRFLVPLMKLLYNYHPFFVFSLNKQKSFLCKTSLTPNTATRECGNISDELVLLTPESASCH